MLEKNLKILFYLKTKKKKLFYFIFKFIMDLKWVKIYEQIKNFIKNNIKTINNLKDFLNKFQSNICFSMCIQCIELLFK
jgi:hypothetical protein